MGAFRLIVSQIQGLDIYGIIAGGKGERRLLALASKERLIKILEKMLDPEEFLSEHGIRS